MRVATCAYLLSQRFNLLIISIYFKLLLSAKKFLNDKKIRAGSLQESALVTIVLTVNNKIQQLNFLLVHIHLLG